MKIEKRDSGNYRIRKMYKGQMYTVSFDYKPIQKKAMQAMAKELEQIRTAHTLMTFQRAAESYVDMKRNVLSPRTIKEYSESVNRFPEWFRRLRRSYGMLSFIRTNLDKKYINFAFITLKYGFTKQVTEKPQTHDFTGKSLSLRL